MYALLPIIQFTRISFIITLALFQDPTNIFPLVRVQKNYSIPPSHTRNCCSKTLSALKTLIHYFFSPNGASAERHVANHNILDVQRCFKKRHKRAMNVEQDTRWIARTESLKDMLLHLLVLGHHSVNTRPNHEYGWLDCPVKFLLWKHLRANTPIISLNARPWPWTRLKFCSLWVQWLSALFLYLDNHFSDIYYPNAPANIPRWLPTNHFEVQQIYIPNCWHAPSTLTTPEYFPPIYKCKLQSLSSTHIFSASSCLRLNSTKDSRTAHMFKVVFQP